MTHDSISEAVYTLELSQAQLVIIEAKFMLESIRLEEVVKYWDEVASLRALYTNEKKTALEARGQLKEVGLLLDKIGDALCSHEK